MGWLNKIAQTSSGAQTQNQIREQRMASTNALKKNVSAKSPAVAAGLTNSAIANKILLQTDLALASDAQVQALVDTQMQLEQQFLAAMKPQDQAATKVAIQRMISQAQQYADQLIRGQAPAQQQASLERKVYWMNMAGQTLAGIGGTVAAGGNPAGFVAGATAWDAASAKAQGQNFGAAELGKSLGMNTVTTLTGGVAGKLIGKGLGALGGAAAEGAIGGAAGAAGRLAGGFGEAVHHLTQSLASGGAKGVATVPHYVAMEMGPEKLSEQLLHHGIHMVMGDHGPIQHPTPQSLQQIQTAITRGTPINVSKETQMSTAAKPAQQPKRASTSTAKGDKMEFAWNKTASGSWEMSKVSQNQAVVAGAQQTIIAAAQNLAAAVSAKLAGGMGDRLTLKNLICRIFPKLVPAACDLWPDADKIKAELLAALPKATGAQYAQAASALGVDSQPFTKVGNGPLPPAAVQAMRGAFSTAKSAEGLREMCKIAARINNRNEKIVK